MPCFLRRRRLFTGANGFNYHPGDAPGDSTRSTIAWQQDVGAVWRSVAINKLRDAHYVGVMRNTLREPQRTNLTQRNSLHAGATTGWSTSGDVAATLSAVTSVSELASAGLADLCSDGYVLKLDNSLGLTVARAVSTGGATTATYTASVFARGGSGALDVGGGASVAFGVSTPFVRVASRALAATAGQVLQVAADAGQIVYFVLGQLELGAQETSPIRTAGASVTRSADPDQVDRVIRLVSPWTYYVKLTGLSLAASGSGIGNFGNGMTGSLNLTFNGPTTIRATWNGGDLARNPAFAVGDTLEIRVSWDGTSFVLAYSLNGGAESSTSVGVTAPATMGDGLIRVGSYSSNNLQHPANYATTKFYPRVMSFAALRAIP